MLFNLILHGSISLKRFFSFAAVIWIKKAAQSYWEQWHNTDQGPGSVLHENVVLHRF